MIYGIRKTVTRVVDFSHRQPLAKNGERVISACYEKMVSLWDMHEGPFDGSRKEKERR